MRLTRLVVGFVLLVVSFASGQWVETTLYLPDSFGGLESPACMAYDSANNTVYVGGGDCVIAIDGATSQRIARIPTGSGGTSLRYNPTNNKIYCANSGDSSVTVIDGAADTVVATIGVGAGPTAFAWNPVQNRVYVANFGGSSISVLRDTGGFVGMEESFMPQAANPRPLPTIIRGALVLPVSPRPRVSESPCLLDACGRKVAELHAGANDVRALAPGVYFVRTAQAQAQAVRKVIITK